MGVALLAALLIGSERAAVLMELAAIVCGYELEHPTRVAIDGVTAAGKTTLAGELADAVCASGRPVVRLTMDDYHHPRSYRYRRGPLSADGYYEDAFDVTSFAANVLIPLGEDGDRRYWPRIHDLASDQAVYEPALEGPADAIVIVDGSFLQRPELAADWDLCIYVDTSLDLALQRGVERDADSLGGREAAAAAYEARYHAAARRYLKEVRPQEWATAVLHNDDPDMPVLRVVRPAEPGPGGPTSDSDLRR